ncbi:MAG: hypothetical protein ACRDU9_05530, partial [Acidimicrobiia bacterium]
MIDFVGTVGPFVLLGLLFIGLRMRYGLTLAILTFFVGVTTVGLTAAWLATGMASGFDSGWWMTAVTLALLWGLLYGLDLAQTRPYSPVQADAREIVAHQELIDGWRRGGVTAYEVFRLRPREKGLVLAHLGLSADTALY